MASTKASPGVTRFEVEREVRSGEWASLGNLESLSFGEGPVYFATRKEAEAELRRSRRAVRPAALRVVEVPDLVPVEPLDLEEFALPLVVRYLRLRGAKHRNGWLEPMLDSKRATVGRDWATVSGWERRAMVFAPEVPLGKLRERFPFARPSTVEDVVRLLTLHELAHVALGHNGLEDSFRHPGRREVLEERFAAMEREADRLTALWWRKGLTPETVTAAAAQLARKAA